MRLTCSARFAYTALGLLCVLPRLLVASVASEVQFGKEEVKEMRPCTIVGTLQSVLQAENLICDLLQQEPRAGRAARRAES